MGAYEFSITPHSKRRTPPRRAGKFELATKLFSRPGTHLFDIVFQRNGTTLDSYLFALYQISSGRTDVAFVLRGRRRSRDQDKNNRKANAGIDQHTTRVSVGDLEAGAAR